MTNKILIDRGLLERVQDVLSRWSEIINYQYCGSMEAMAYLQVTDDMSQPVLNEVNAALDAPQQEAVVFPVLPAAPRPLPGRRDLGTADRGDDPLTGA